MRWQQAGVLQEECLVQPARQRSDSGPTQAGVAHVDNFKGVGNLKVQK